MLISGLTTVIGFGALLVTNVPAVFELGAFSVLGVALLHAALAHRRSGGARAAAAAGLVRPAGRSCACSGRIQAVFDAVLRLFNHSSARYSRA